jgi:hypothetical protein
MMWLSHLERYEAGNVDRVAKTELLWPRLAARPLGAKIPQRFAALAAEAAAVLALSPRASAALSRRALQELLREMGASVSTLEKEIKWIIGTGMLPNCLARDLDAVRVIGNFAAHPIKDLHTGEIVEVEPDEAEWTLETLEAMLKFQYVDSSLSEAPRMAVNEKLSQAGKPPLA